MQCRKFSKISHADADIMQLQRMAVWRRDEIDDGEDEDSENDGDSDTESERSKWISGLRRS